MAANFYLSGLFVYFICCWRCEVANNDAGMRNNFASQMVNCILYHCIEDQNYQSNECKDARLFHALSLFMSNGMASEIDVRYVMMSDLLNGATTNANICGKIRLGDSGAGVDAQIAQFYSSIANKPTPHTAEYLIGQIKKLSSDIQKQTNIIIFISEFNDRNPIITKCSLCFVLLTFFCYLFMIIKIPCAQNGNLSIRQTIFKSLGLIVFIQCYGWLINLINQHMLLANLELEVELKKFVTTCLSCFISFATNSEIILLYYTSSDHRRAFNKTFGWLFRIISTLNNSTISPAAPTGINLNLKGLPTPNCEQNIIHHKNLNYKQF